MANIAEEKYVPRLKAKYQSEIAPAPDEEIRLQEPHADPQAG